ncbi:molybdenum cofactor guanylyltransferase [Pseudarthrobacter sp. P1]|uniref:molybdenum cofactor guanylyltransferase n=1 Tax=Pseudarthrobacter sp. P1 TaxID=3418418 RepID=UPI003CEFDB02
MAQSAIVLAGGRSSRLGGVSKAALEYDGEALLARTVAAVRSVLERPGCRVPMAVVGPEAEAAALLETVPGALLVREDPPFAGPAAAIAAGLAALPPQDREPGARVVVLACDMPGIAGALEALSGWLADHPEAAGAIAVDAGRDQPLAAVYPAAGLGAALADLRATRGLENAPVHPLVASLEAAGLPLARVIVPAASTADVDTWADAAQLGVGPHRATEPGTI